MEKNITTFKSADIYASHDVEVKYIGLGWGINDIRYVEQLLYTELSALSNKENATISQYIETSHNGKKLEFDIFDFIHIIQ